MKTRAFAFNIRKEDYKTIEELLRIVTDKEIETIDLRSYEAKSESEDLIIIFGKRAEKTCRDLKCKAKIELNEIEKYDKDFGDPEERIEAEQQLLKFREMLVNEKQRQRDYYKERSEIITKDQLPEVAEVQTGVVDKFWIGLTKDGRKIKLSQQPEFGTADINLTFEEFDMLGRFMKVFEIKETEIVYKPTTNNREISTK